MGNRSHGSLRSSRFALPLLSLLLLGTALTATPLWPYVTGAKIDSSPTLGWDGTLYIGSDDEKLHAIHPDGSYRWHYSSDNWVQATPAVAPNGTVYITDWNFHLSAINPADGTLLWPPFETFNFIYSSPAIGPDGTIYVGSADDDLYAIKPDGTLKWIFPTGDWIFSSPAVGPDGIIYFGSWDNYVYAVSPAGELEWDYFTGDVVYSSPALGPDGTIYVGAGKRVLALSSSGFRLWQFPETGELTGLVDSSPAIGPNGTVYVGSGDRHLYALNPVTGAEIWRYLTGGAIYSSPAVAANGDIYITSRDGFLYSISSDGQLKEKIPINAPSDSSPMIGPDGVVYVGSRDGKVYAFEGESRLAASAWPAFRANRSRDGTRPQLFAHWVAEFELDPPEEGPFADPSGDGLPNLLTYALGGSATVADRSLLPAVPNGAFSFQQDLRKADLIYQPQFSEDLVNWIDLEHLLDSPATAVQTRSIVPQPESDRGFYRLRVTRF